MRYRSRTHSHPLIPSHSHSLIHTQGVPHSPPLIPSHSHSLIHTQGVPHSPPLVPSLSQGVPHSPPLIPSHSHSLIHTQGVPHSPPLVPSHSHCPHSHTGCTTLTSPRPLTLSLPSFTHRVYHTHLPSSPHTVTPSHSHCPHSHTGCTWALQRHAGTTHRHHSSVLNLLLWLWGGQAASDKDTQSRAHVCIMIIMGCRHLYACHVN